MTELTLTVKGWLTARIAVADEILVFLAVNHSQVASHWSCRKVPLGLESLISIEFQEGFEAVAEVIIDS